MFKKSRGKLFFIVVRYVLSPSLSSHSKTEKRRISYISDIKSACLFHTSTSSLSFAFLLQGIQNLATFVNSDFVTLSSLQFDILVVCISFFTSVGLIKLYGLLQSTASITALRCLTKRSSCNESCHLQYSNKHIADAYCTGKWFDSYCNCMVCDYKRKRCKKFHGLMYQTHA